jgi:hypothetical protein
MTFMTVGCVLCVWVVLSALHWSISIPKRRMMNDMAMWACGEFGDCVRCVLLLLAHHKHVRRFESMFVKVEIFPSRGEHMSVN